MVYKFLSRIMNPSFLPYAYAILVAFWPYLAKRMLTYSEDETDGELMGFRRFLARRRKPRKIVLTISLSVMVTFFAALMMTKQSLGFGFTMAIMAALPLCFEKIFTRILIWTAKSENFYHCWIPLVIIAAAPGGYPLSMVGCFIMMTAYVFPDKKIFEEQHDFSDPNQEDLWQDKNDSTDSIKCKKNRNENRKEDKAAACDNSEGQSKTDGSTSIVHQSAEKPISNAHRRHKKRKNKSKKYNNPRSLLAAINQQQ